MRDDGSRIDGLSSLLATKARKNISFVSFVSLWFICTMIEVFWCS